MEGLLDYLRQGYAHQGQVAARFMASFTAQIILAIIVFFVARVVASKLQTSVARAMGFARADAHVILLASRSARVGVWIVAVLVILGLFGIGWTALATAVGLIGLAITISLQDVLKNFVAGVYLLIERPFRIGDQVRVKDFVGIVEDIGLRITFLRAADGNQVIIPNATIFVEVVINSGPTGGKVTAKEKVEHK
ncbi:MAG: mechanosensitive ion channel [Dehalococcoidia bacterium]|nr:mechanosensitive ion channel [Dehalococcoidia bacterium]